MKITWTIAALAGSVTLVNAQQTGKPGTPPRAPTPPAAPAPTARPRVAPPESVLAPLPWTSLIAPGEMPLTPFPPLAALEPLIAPGQMSIEFPPLPSIEFTPVPGQWSFEFPPMPALPSMAPTPAMAPWSPLPGMAPMAVDMPMLITPTVPPEPITFDLLPGQGPVTPRPPRDRELDAELRRLTMELERAEAARQRSIQAQDRQHTREVEAQQRTLERQLEQTIRSIEAQDRAAQRELEQTVRNLEAQDRAVQRQLEQQLSQTERQIEQQLAQTQRQTEMQQRAMERELEQHLRSAQRAAETSHSLSWSHADTRVTVPAPWAPQDVADSAWRVARELFNRGEYGQAVQAFRTLPVQYPNSAYAGEAAYYQAFALFRIGGTAELREALTALEAARAKYPNMRASTRTEMTNLATRIRGVLAQRGDAGARAELARTASEQTVTCDREEQAVQAEAMNALSRSDAGNVNELITRVLARKDECAVPLRRTAVFLVGNRRDAQAVTILAGVARNDPSVDVRVSAIEIIGRLPNEEGVPVLEELARSDDERVQRSAIRALVRHQSARARTSVRSLVERDDVSERVRSEALSAFNSEQATADDVAWLRALYAKVSTPTLKARTLSAIVRVGGPEVDQWLITVARDDAQPSEIRATAMRRIGQTLPIADLGRLYDTATQQRFRSEIISQLGKRKEDAAADKLIDIVKNGTDPSLRTAAIRAITEKNDPRATQLLLEIINK